MVKRYTVNEAGDLFRVDDGEVVLWKDYDALATRLAHEQASNATLLRALAEVNDLNVVRRTAMVNLHEHIEKLDARLAEAERDAARYRWLRNTATTSDWCDLGGLTAERTDEEIDKALGAVSAPDRETGVTP